jgi:hypothetical protein
MFDGSPKPGSHAVCHGPFAGSALRSSTGRLTVFQRVPSPAGAAYRWPSNGVSERNDAIAGLPSPGSPTGSKCAPSAERSRRAPVPRATDEIELTYSAGSVSERPRKTVMPR